MTWEETIVYARTKEEFKQLIEDTYLDSDLKKNVEKFKSSPEFIETLKLIQKNFNSTNATKTLALLDIGAGNGISSVAFALNNFKVTAVEPDLSELVGCGAIMILKSAYKRENLEVVSSHGELLPFENGSFDVVYARQSMHHSQNLGQFVKEAARVLKKGGVFFTCRDHVVNNLAQKNEFLKTHPLQKFYEGENAYSIEEYTQAFKNAGLNVQEELGPLDSVINFSPRTKKDLLVEFRVFFEKKLLVRVPDTSIFNSLLFILFRWKTKNMFDVPGRLYSFIAKKTD